MLIGWELGEGFGHVTRLADAARALSRSGWDVNFAVQDPGALAIVAPEFPRRPTPVYTRALKDPASFRARSYADILAAVGFGHVSTLYPVVTAWHKIFDEVKPDLIVCDYSPILCLAAYGAIPTITIGDGFVLPPGDAPSYPKLRPGDSGLPNEESMLTVTRLLQLDLGHAWPPSLPKITAGSLQISTVIEELDIYAAYRRNLVCAPFSTRPQPLGPATIGGFFLYLTAQSPATRKILQVLADLGIPFEVFLRDADTDLKTRVRRTGALVHDDPPLLDAALSKRSAVIHHGGIGTSQRALALGRPQLITPRHFEQTLTAAALERLSVGVWMRRHCGLDEFRAIFDKSLSGLGDRAAALGRIISKRKYADFREVIVAEAKRVGAVGTRHGELPGRDHVYQPPSSPKT